MHKTSYFKPHAMLAFYEISKAPKELIKKEETADFGMEIDLACTLFESDPERVKNEIKKVGLDVEMFQDNHSLLLALAYHRNCKEKMDYYKRDKTLRFIKTFNETYQNMTEEYCLEIIKSLEIHYEDFEQASKLLEEMCVLHELKRNY